MQPVSFFIRSIHRKLKKKKEKKHHKIMKDNLQNKTIELNENNEWNKANKKAHEMVSEMIDNEQQGMIVVTTNINQLTKSNHQVARQNIPFSMIINSDQYMEKENNSWTIFYLFILFKKYYI
ncbi:hypothetical protein RFI_20545 [Reticulomyxa filosa]|uniref:Uncharacterized protein n=1 Tax=Reticulomyxa filosa TaxID=46433 RepID=X6MSG9_RETFI|nr:hypothetical protein RFI_20545 [Reticulomyxa filosa]|eukprot:ETO16794.1 hypothetical protein RFI_20545 [Reticulomyxa filosa]